MTLCMVYQHPRLLLGMKKRGFATGTWNGFGGKVNEGENIRESAIRELKEEAMIEVEEIVKKGILTFKLKDSGDVLEAHLFHISKFKGEPKETEEMKPAWFHIDELPFSQMWPDDVHWMPLFLGGKKFKGKFLLDRASDITYQAKILEKELIEVENI
ncbi:MAG: hypothetical protein UU82_C0010G0004 [Candidatus Nomurabacteria bacterium GW2011_GWC2_41_8]|nr:MAG: hypothetical protein UU58_C0004G0033 [Candidatus Nomurabacteria bacterium GW2011_GWA2_41_25]KKS24156.1 MAG: hypothetical protein UU82_C0010G0004 [Candidatus Nomurabacteria bacterium GW2011_GWC2_41_8]